MMKGYVKFNRVISERKEYVYDVVDKNGDELGRIYYWDKWKKYIFEPIGSTCYDRECLSQISGFLFHLDYQKEYDDEMKKPIR